MFPVGHIMHTRGWNSLRNPSLTDGRFLIALITLAGCSSSSQSLAEPDAATVPGVCGATDALTGPTPQTPPTLETGVDQAAFAAAVTPQAIQWVYGAQPGAATDTILLGRPWGEFDIHKGPQLVFRGSWRLLVGSGGDYSAVAGVVRDGDSYKMISIGSPQFVPTMVAREQIPAVSAALDRGRAGFLRGTCDGGERYLAYEAKAVADSGQAEIRVQPLALQVIDANMPGVADMSLDELNASLPAE